MYFVCSGDGTLTSFDIRKHKMKVQSELFDSELLSLAAVKVRPTGVLPDIPTFVVSKLWVNEG